MRAVIQRVSSASVTIGGAVKSSIGEGLMILLGIGYDDGPVTICIDTKNKEWNTQAKLSTIPNPCKPCKDLQAP